MARSQYLYEIWVTEPDEPFECAERFLPAFTVKYEAEAALRWLEARETHGCHYTIIRRREGSYEFNIYKKKVESGRAEEVR